jgi:hypothetical protein
MTRKVYPDFSHPDARKNSGASPNPPDKPIPNFSHQDGHKRCMEDPDRSPAPPHFSHPEARNPAPR